MEKKKKIVLGLASIWAGGGHNALRDFLVEELEKDDRYEIHSFTHSSKSFDETNDKVWAKLGNVYDFLYKTTPNEYSSISAIQLVKECDEFVKEYDPDIVIGTNFGIAAAFQLVKNSLKLHFTNVYAIPDYGIPSAAAVPTNKILKPDYIIVFDEAAKAGIARKLKFPKEKILVSGYIARKTFRDLIAENSKKSKETLVSEIKADIGKTYGAGISANKRTMMVMGGAGGITQKSYGLLKTVVKYQEENPEFIEKNQILIATGQNKEYLIKLFKHHINEEKEWSNIIPIPWINHDIYAKMQVLADFPIMVSIAPASMNELFESKCGPLLIHNSRKGQEGPNVNFVVKNKMGVYLPKKKDALAKIIKGFTDKEKEEFIDHAKKYKEVRQGRIKNLPDDVMKIYQMFTTPKRATDKKRLNLSINYKIISPKVWWTILILMLPVSIFYGFIQYYRQKDKLVTNKYFQNAMNYISKLVPI